MGIDMAGRDYMVMVRRRGGRCGAGAEQKERQAELGHGARQEEQRMPGCSRAI